jgi:hypothetical protein
MLAILAAASLVVSTQVRTTDPVLGPALTEGLRQSTVIRRLVDDIDASDVIVYLARGDCPRPAIACVMMAGGGPDVRYVRINFRLPIGLGKPGFCTRTNWRSRSLMNCSMPSKSPNGGTWSMARRCRLPTPGAVSIEAARI